MDTSWGENVKAKKALSLFAVMLALASAAAIGVLLPDNYPTPEAVSPQQTVLAAPQAPIPIASQPGHPGGNYTQVVATCYGLIKINSVNVGSSSVFSASTHVSPDNLLAFTSFVADTRDYVWVNFSLNDNRDDVKMIYITIQAPAGVDSNLSTSNDVFHVSPGVWVAKSDNLASNQIKFKIYGQPISSGDRYTTITFTAQ